MTDIETSLEKLIKSLDDPIDKDEVNYLWGQHCKIFPDLSRAMMFLQKALIDKVNTRCHNKEKSTIMVGQYMENLRWAIKK